MTDMPIIDVVDVVLPCLDESAALPWVLSRMPPGYRAIVVDNGSTDDSVAVARRHGAVVLHEARRGYGAAVHAGLLAASAPYVAVLDCDATMDPGELPSLVAPLRAGTAELVCGRRRPLRRGVWPWHARIGSRLLAALTFANGCRLHDIAPMRVAPRDALLTLGVRDRRSGYPLETLRLAAARGWRIAELDIAYRARQDGSVSKVTGSLRGTAIAVWDFLSVLTGGTDRAEPARPVAVDGQVAW